MRRLGCVWGCDSDRLWLGVGLAQGETSKCCLCATFDTAGMRGDRLLGEWHAGLVVRTVVRYVFVHSWVLCRVDEGKKRLESWEVLQMLEEDGVCARPRRRNWVMYRGGLPHATGCFLLVVVVHTRAKVGRDDPHY